MSDRREFEAALEAILFVTGEPVSEERLLAVFDEAERPAARESLAALRARYATSEGRGVFLEEVAGGLRIVTAPELHPYLKKFFEAAGGNRLSMAALETLAIVAYRQPITGPEIQDLRGKNPATALKTLLERRMLRITGRKEVVGRPFLYATTRDFLMHFGLRSLADLPPLEEFEEAFGAGDDGFAAGEPRARGSERLGLVATDEAEAELGSAAYDLHEAPGARDGAATGELGSRGDGTSVAADAGPADEAAAMAAQSGDERSGS